MSKCNKCRYITPNIGCCVCLSRSVWFYGSISPSFLVSKQSSFCSNHFWSCLNSYLSFYIQSVYMFLTLYLHTPFSSFVCYSDKSLLIILNVRVARSKKVKKAKFVHKQFQKGQIPKTEKRPNKGQISCKKIVKIT